MSGGYQLLGLVLTVLCHIIVTYYVNEQKYSFHTFVVISFVYAVFLSA